MSLMKEAVDVVELCALLQCLGFNVKSVEVKDDNVNVDNATCKITISCQTSRLEVKMESVESPCSCPPGGKDISGFWQVSGITGGKQHNMESGSELIGCLPKMRQEMVTKELQDIIKYIKSCKPGEKSIDGNRSSSTLELSAPEMRLQTKPDTPTRYRSLDALISSEEASAVPCVPGSLKDRKVKALLRQSTYTVSSTPKIFGANKTSSPIQRTNVAKIVVDKLNEAGKYADEINKIIFTIIQDFSEDNESDSSCLGLDVSKISVLKVLDTPTGHSFSSPNIPSLVKPSDTDRNLKRSESSTSTKSEKGLSSRLRRFSPSFLKIKKDIDETSKADKKSKQSKITNLFKPKSAAGATASNTPNFNSSKNKYCHIKSTIPKLTSGKSKD